MPSIEEVYDTVSVYKSVIITEDDHDCRYMKDVLYTMDIDTSIVTRDHIDDERPLYSTQLRMFHESINRALCISFDAWLSLRDECGYDYNLLYFYNLDPEYQRICLDWVKDYRRRGFKMPGACSFHIGNENFLMNISEA